MQQTIVWREPMMNPATSVSAQENGDRGSYWRAFGNGSPLFGDVGALPTLGKLSSGDVSSSGDELALKVRKPYTITKQRERWTEEEHTKFLEALKLYGRAWRRIEEHIGTKTAVQIRSHAQKFFSKLEREAIAAGGVVAGISHEIDIPPPRPKRKPSHPYPRKAGGSFSGSPSVADEDASPPAAAAAVPSKSGMSGDAFVKSAGFPPCSKSKPPPLDIPSPAAQPSESPASLKLFGQTVVVPAHTSGASSDGHTTVVSGAGGADGACETSEDRTQSSKDMKTLLPRAELRGLEKCGTKRLPACSNVELSTAGSSQVTVLESGISVLEGGSVSNAADNRREAEQSSHGRCSQSKRKDTCHARHEDSPATFAGPEGPFDFSQYRGTATVAHHLAAALSAGMHLHSLSALPEKPPFTLMDFAAMNPASYMAGFPGLPGGIPTAPQHSAFSLESLVRLTPWHTGIERPAFPPGLWPGLLPGGAATCLPLPMAMPIPAGMPRLRASVEGASGQDDGGAAAAVAAATIAAASAWWALQGSVPPGVVHPGMAAMYNPSAAVAAAAAAAAVASVAEAAVVQSCCPSGRSSDHRGKEVEPEDQQQVGSNDSEDGVAEDSPGRKSSAVRRAERASRMKEQKARRASLGAQNVCSDSSPSGWGNSRPSRAGSFCESSAFPGRMKIKGDKVGLNQKDVEKRPSPSSSDDDGGRKRARVRSMSASNSPTGEERLSDDGDKSGDERGQPTSSDGSGSEAGDPPVGRGGGGQSSDSSGCGNIQGEGGSSNGGSSDGEDVGRSRSPEGERDEGHAPENRVHSGSGGGSTTLHAKSAWADAEQPNSIECNRVSRDEQLASEGPTADKNSLQRGAQRMKTGEAGPLSRLQVDCQGSHVERTGNPVAVPDSSPRPCPGSSGQDDRRNSSSAKKLKETAARERGEEEACSSVEKRNEQNTTLESTTQHSRENCPSSLREHAADAAASQDDAAARLGNGRGIDSDAEAHLQRLSMLRKCPTSASSSGSARFSGAGFVPYQRTSTEASGTDNPGSKGERLHLRSEDAGNFEGQSWKQKRRWTNEESVPA